MPSAFFHFQSEDTDFKLSHQNEVVDWLEALAEAENQNIDSIEYIFCSDNYLLEINKKYLNHDYFTDILTFPLQKDPIEANVFISIERVKENAQLYAQSFEDELHRVIAHGLLHLSGYNDKSAEDEAQMRKKEDYYLAQRTFI